MVLLSLMQPITDLPPVPVSNQPFLDQEFQAPLNFAPPFDQGYNQLHNNILHNDLQNNHSNIAYDPTRSKMYGADSVVHSMHSHENQYYVGSSPINSNHTQRFGYQPPLLAHPIPQQITSFASEILSVSSAPEITVTKSEPASSTTSTTKTRRHRRVATLDPVVRRARNVKHNEAEIRRRQRLNGVLTELAGLVGCDRPHKSAILRTTVDRVKEYEKRIADLNSQLNNLQSEQSRILSMIHTFPSSSSISSINSPSSQSTSAYSHSSTPHSVLAVKSERSGMTTLNSSVNSLQLKHPSNGDAQLLMPLPFPPMDSVSTIHNFRASVHISDINGRILDCNELFAHFTGFSRQSLISSHAGLYSILHAESQTAFYNMTNVLGSSNTQSVQHTECLYLCKNGISRSAMLTSWAIFDEVGNRHLIASIVSPIQANRI